MQTIINTSRGHLNAIEFIVWPFYWLRDYENLTEDEQLHVFQTAIQVRSIHIR